MRGLQQWLGERRDNPLDIQIYPGKANSHVIYLDDGESTQAERARAYRTVEIRHAPKPDGGRSIDIRRLHDAFVPAETHFTLTLWATGAPTKMSVSGNGLTQMEDAGAFAQHAGDCYFVDAALEAVRVKLIDDRPALTLEIA